MSDQDQPQIPSATLAAPRVAVLLCTYNEVENLPELMAQLSQHLPQADVLVVDDSSPDGTSNWVRAQPNYRGLDEVRPDATSDSRSTLRVEYRVLDKLQAGVPSQQRVGDQAGELYLLQRSGKHGLGTATRAGMQWCLERGYDYVIQLDADLSHPPEIAPQLLAACRSSQPACDVAIGSRYVTGGGLEGLALHRRWISRALNAYATTLLRLPIEDCSGSYRCYRTASLRQIDFAKLTCPGYGFLEEILVALYRSGAQLAEIPIQFEARAGGHSKLSLGDALGALQVIHKLALRR